MSVPQYTWHDGTGLYRTVDIEHSRGEPAMWVIVDPDGEYRLMEPVEVWSRVQDSLSATQEIIPGPSALDDVPPHVRARAYERARWVALMVTGDPDGDLLTGEPSSPERIRARFHPDLLEQVRVDRMVEDLNTLGHTVSARSLRRWAQQLRSPGGVANLVDGRRRQPRQTVDPLPSEVRAHLEAFAASRVDETTVSRRTLVTLFRAYCGARAVELTIGEAVLDRAIRDAAARHGLDKAAVQRRSMRTRDPDHQSAWQITAPYEVLQLDSSPLNLFCLDQYGKVLNTLHLVVAVDAFSGMVRALRLVGGDDPFSAATVKGLLLDTVAGRLLMDGSSGAASPVLARAVHVPVAAIVIDRGAQFNSVRALGAAAGIGIHAVVAPPARGDRKPSVESFFGVAAALCELLPGAKGANTQQRGRNPERGLLLRVEDVVALLWALIAGYYHHTPRSPHPRYPGTRLTPHQKEQLYWDTNAVLEVDANPWRVLELMDRDTRALSDDGIRINNHLYWHPSLNAPRAAGRGSEKRKIVVYHDQQHPDAIIAILDGRPLVVPSRTAGRPAPVLDDMLDRALRRLQGPGGAVAPVSADTVRQAVTELAQQLAQPALPRRSSRPHPETTAANSTTDDAITRALQRLIDAPPDDGTDGD